MWLHVMCQRTLLERVNDVSSKGSIFVIVADITASWSPLQTGAELSNLPIGQLVYVDIHLWLIR